MKKIYIFTVLFVLYSCTLCAKEIKLDNILEQIQNTTNKKEKVALLNQLKHELIKINQKSREESNAIFKARQKRPTKLFKMEQ